MAAPAKWLNTLIHTQEKLAKKWGLLKHPTGKGGLANWKRGFKTLRFRDHSPSSPPPNDAFHAPSRYTQAAGPERAAVRIQTAFRAFLARRALKALRGIVRIQALVRGRQVRKQAALTLRCMQALVRVQARVRARRVRMSVQGQAVQKLLDQRRTKANLLKQAEEGWCDSIRTLDEVKSKLVMRQDGAFKRERALAYALAQKQLRSIPGSEGYGHISLKNFEVAKNSWGWSWLERWMAAKPWENRLLEEVQTATTSDLTPPPSKTVASSSLKGKCTRSSELTPTYSVKVRKNNVTTRISARPPLACTRSSTSPSSELKYGESSGSSSVGVSMTPGSGSEEAVGSGVPNYMNLTESNKAKRRNGSHLARRRQSMDEIQFTKLGGFSTAVNLKSSGF